MTDVAATVRASVTSVQLALKVLYALAITNWQYHPVCTVTNGTTYDFVIVGAGAAGSILANRLSANSSYSVLVIEAGGFPPLESDLAGVFPTLPSSDYDYNMTSVNDNYTAQNLQNQVIELTAGKMLGGSSSLDHMIHVHGDPHDYNNWASILGDDSWKYTNVRQYLMMQENLVDLGLLNSSYASLHGKNGYINLSRQMSSENDLILNACEEAGHNVVNDTTSTTSTLGVAEPLFAIDNKIRQNNAIKYLGRDVVRNNLCISLYSKATKILFENSTAVGIRFVYESEYYDVYAGKEVIISAGALNSPKLLMLSGIGNQTDLESLGIDVIANLPVGKRYQNHPSASLIYQMESDTSADPDTNPYQFPVPTTCLYGTVNSSQTYPDYQAIMLRFPHDSTAMIQLCGASFKYTNDICNEMYAASSNRNILYVVFNLMIPKSNGKLLLASADHNDDPLIYTGIYSDPADLKLMVKSLADFHKLTNTTSFKSVNATLADLGLCSNTTKYSDDFWECYAIAMSAGMWHDVGTCAMGSVVSTDLTVKGVDNLRVIDASVMPTEVSGNIKSAVNMIAERGSNIIMNKYY